MWLRIASNKTHKKDLCKWGNSVAVFMFPSFPVALQFGALSLHLGTLTMRFIRRYGSAGCLFMGIGGVRAININHTKAV